MKKRELVLGGLCLLALVLLPGRREAADLPADAPAELPAETNYIALTFDDGPNRGTTDRLLDGLK